MSNIHIYIYRYVYVFMYIHIYIDIHVYINVYVSYLYIYIYIYMYVHTYMRKCIVIITIARLPFGYIGFTTWTLEDGRRPRLPEVLHPGQHFEMLSMFCLRQLREAYLDKNICMYPWNFTSD